MSAGVKVLHLTDIHIGSNEFIYENISHMALRIGDEFENLDEKIELVLVTGDIFSGEANFDSDEDKIINEACSFFETLLNRLIINSNSDLCKNDFLFIPGNHDINRKALDERGLFDIYRKFLLRFYGDDRKVYELYDKEYLYRIRVFKDKQIVIAGLNSCMFEKYVPKSKDFEWINDIDLRSINNLDEISLKEVKERISESHNKKLSEIYYDYGYIKPEQFTRFKDELKNKVKNISSYSTIVAFHHHFYMFPELYNRNGDSSLLKNFESINLQLSKLNTKIIIHGHKHLQQITPILTDEYLQKPDSLMYAISGGNIGNKNQWNGTFQLIEVFNHNLQSKIARILPFEYVGEKLKNLNSIILPPQSPEESSNEEKLLSILKTEKEELFAKYEDEISDVDKISMHLDIEKIIINLGNILTSFSEIKRDLHKNPEQILWILLFSHYKAISIAKFYNKSLSGTDIRCKIKNLFTKECSEQPEFVDQVFKFIELGIGIEKDNLYNSLSDMTSTSKQKHIKAFATVVDVFTELYLVISEFSDYYYEQFSHKVNIKLEKDSFQKHIPSRYIEFKTKADLRTVYISMRSKHPTCHKIAVLFVKLFENLLPKYGKDFDNISLKIFYIRPDIIKSSAYQLEDYNFEAYIPSLLPLLIGKNIYKQTEVFIRELIQNSMDAILLRRLLSKEANSFDETIRIEYGIEDINNRIESEHLEPLNYLIVQDNGIGMTSAQIERYFIHIGRSYYGSQEYNDLIDKNNLSYKPISKFGIGFLSSFLFAQDIRVETLNYQLGESGVSIYIPNHEGCFFSKKEDSISSIGTKMILYQNKNNGLSFNNISQYIKAAILDIQLNINIVQLRADGTKDQLRLEAFRFRKELLEMSDITNPLFFIPLDENGVVHRDFSDLQLLQNEPFGIFVQYNPNVESWKGSIGEYIELNSGILLNNTSEKGGNNRIGNKHFNLYLNFPPNYIELDVSREKINNFLKIGNSNYSFVDKCFRNEIMEVLLEQFIQWLNKAKEDKLKVEIIRLFRIVIFFKDNNTKKVDAFLSQLYTLALKYNDKSIVYDFVENSKSTEIQGRLLVDSVYSIFEVLVCNLPTYMNNLILNIFKNEELKELYSSKYTAEEFQIIRKNFDAIIEKISYNDIPKVQLERLFMDYEKTFESAKEDILSDRKYVNSGYKTIINFNDSEKVRNFEKQFLTEVKSKNPRTQIIKKNLPSKTFSILNNLIWDFIEYEFFNILLLFYNTTIKNIEEEDCKKVVNIGTYISKFLKIK